MGVEQYIENNQGFLQLLGFKIRVTFPSFTDAYFPLIPRVFQPRFLGNLGIWGKLQEFCNPKHDKVNQLISTEVLIMI